MPDPLANATTPPPPNPRPAPSWAESHLQIDLSQPWWDQFAELRRRSITGSPGGTLSTHEMALIKTIPIAAYWEGRAHDAEQALGELRKQHDVPSTDPYGTLRADPNTTEPVTLAVRRDDTLDRRSGYPLWMLLNSERAGSLLDDEAVQGWDRVGAVPGTPAAATAS